jgi:hypothetical protein
MRSREGRLVHSGNSLDTQKSKELLHTPLELKVPARGHRPGVVPDLDVRRHPLVLSHVLLVDGVEDRVVRGRQGTPVDEGVVNG